MRGRTRADELLFAIAKLQRTQFGHRRAVFLEHFVDANETETTPSARVEVSTLIESLRSEKRWHEPPTRRSS